mmetsp:Transcript_6708/g.17169  ORF Transcript_6708/g.17169 Transcript_6708/m.17169 type:complete len:488 (+) Transcript_6708:44-1507(+)
MALKMLAFLGVVAVLLAAGSCSAEVHNFQTFAACNDLGTTFVSSYKLLTFDASVLMDAHADTFTDHYNYVADGTSNGVDPTKGETQLLLNIEIAKDGIVPPSGILKAHVHSQRCEISQGGPHLMNDMKGLDSGTNILEVLLLFDGGTFKSTGSVQQEWLADYDQAASVVLHDPNGVRIACCNMVPTVPLLPDTWSATIEANFQQPAANISYTMIRKEWYDKASQNMRIDEHSAYSKQTRLVNVKYDHMLLLHRNETFVDGICEDHSLSSDMRQFLTRNGNHTLMSTADMFGFKGDSPDVYHGVTGPSEWVRGIPCEKWTRNVSVPGFSRGSGGAPTGGVNYTFEFYFPVSSWMVRRETYHRLLSRVVLRSDSGFRGIPVLHYYDFVDMVPLIPDMNVFNPCDLYYGSKPMAGNCTCGLPGAPAAPPSYAVVVEEDDKKAMMYVAIAAVVCLVVGALSGLGGTYVYFTRCGGVERNQMKHTEMTSNAF